MIRFALAVAMLVPTVVFAQSYPSAEMLKGFAPQVYAAAHKAEVFAANYEVTQTFSISECKKADVELREALEKDTLNMDKLRNYLRAYQSQDTGGRLDRLKIDVLEAYDKHPGGDPREFGVWMNATALYSKKVRSMWQSIDSKLVQAVKDKLGIK